MEAAIHTHTHAHGCTEIPPHVWHLRANDAYSRSSDESGWRKGKEAFVVQERKKGGGGGGDSVRGVNEKDSVEHKHSMS